MSIDERVKSIMELKTEVGEFSLDLYYNDLDRYHPYTAKLSSAMENGFSYHARGESFAEALSIIESFMAGWLRGTR